VNTAKARATELAKHYLLEVHDGRLQHADNYREVEDLVECLIEASVIAMAESANANTQAHNMDAAFLRDLSDRLENLVPSADLERLGEIAGKLERS
jgi:hypothetical protein